jgi:hypothetical protein
MSTPTPEEAFLEYARGTGWDETAVRVVLDTVRKARRAAALEMRERCVAAVEAHQYPPSYICGPEPNPRRVRRDLAAAIRALDVP